MKRIPQVRNAIFMVAYLAALALLLAAGSWWFTQGITYWVPQSGMSPVILAGDRLFALRDYYRERAPKRGDIAVYLLPKNPEVVFIQRVIGLPGDRIRITGGVLHINDTPVVRESRGVRKTNFRAGETLAVTEYEEMLPNGCRHLIWERSDQEPLDDTPEYLVPPDHAFFLGDNRDHSLDSRASERVGFVPLRSILHRPAFVYYRPEGKSRMATAVQCLP